MVEAGELASLTAKRREAMGQRIHVLDPFGISGPSTEKWRASYNPLDVLKMGSATFLEDAALIAESIVVQSPDQKDPHWDDSAKNFIEGVIVHVATASQHADKRHLVTVRELLKKALWVPPENEEENGKPAKRRAKPVLFLEMMHNAERLDADPETADIGSAVMAAALDFYGKTETEISGVHSTVNRHTKFLDYTAFRKVLQHTDFDLRALKADPAGMSVYLCFPATRVELSKRWMRLFVNQMLDAMEREKTKPAVPVLACLDEFPVLGYMKQLETAAGQIASFDVKLWVILQDWNQGKALYGERWETFAGNAGLMQFFGNNDQTTTEYISKRLGKTQVEVARMGEVAQDQQSKGLSGRSETIELYDLLTPDEITRQFARDDRLKRQLVMLAGRHPMMRSMARKKREAPVSYRPPAELRGEFDARVRNSGLSVNAFITAAVFGQVAPRTRRVTPLDQQMLAMLLSQAARISTHLGAAPTGSPLTQAAILQCRDDLAVIRQVVMQVLRRES